MENARKGAAKTQQYSGKVVPPVDWGDLRVFLVCAGKASFRAAGRDLSMDSSTVTRRIERLEQTLETQLFNRLSEGIRLTEEGTRIVHEVQAMEQASFNVLRKSRVAADDIKGVVRFAITEGLGTYWLLPRLLEFQKENRLITIDMECTMTPTDVGRLQADISIQFDRAERPDLIAVRLGYLHIYPFVSKGYAEQFGVPNTKAEIIGHRIIYQFGPLLDESADELEVESLEGIVGFRTNVSTAVLYAIERGAGIGFLPSYASVLAGNLLPVDMELHRRLEIWMTYHPNLKRSRRHAVVVEWLRKIFDARSFPCFGQDFIHPNQLRELMHSSASVNKGDGYSAPFPTTDVRPVWLDCAKAEPDPDIEP